MFDLFEQQCAAVKKPIPTLGKTFDFWRKEPPIVRILPNGDVELVRGGMNPPQLRWWNLPNFTKVFVGGYGAGKTKTLCKRVITAALQNAPAPVATVSPSYPLARETIVTTIQELLSGKRSIYGSGAFYWTYLKRDHSFIIKFRGRKARIIVYSGEDPLSLRGPNLGAAYIDEPFIQDVEVYKQMIARVRHPEARFKEIGLAGTSEGLGWGYDLCLGEMRDAPGADVGFIQASTRTNVTLGENYVIRLESGFSGKAAEAYIEGGFVNLSEGAVYYGFTSAPPGEKLGGNLDERPVPESAELFCGMDFNVDPMSSLVGWRLGNHVHYFDEILLPNADTEYMCQVLREKYVNEDTRITKQILRKICPDATGTERHTNAPRGRTDFWYIRQAGFDIFANSQSPSVRDRENAVNGKFAPKIGGPSLTISPKCKKLIQYLMTYTHELAHTKGHKNMSHLLDAMGYPIVYMFPIVKTHTLRLTGT